MPPKHLFLIALSSITLALSSTVFARGFHFQENQKIGVEKGFRYFLSKEDGRCKKETTTPRWSSSKVSKKTYEIVNMKNCMVDIIAKKVREKAGSCEAIVPKVGGCAYENCRLLDPDDNGWKSSLEMRKNCQCFRIKRQSYRRKLYIEFPFVKKADLFTPTLNECLDLVPEGDYQYRRAFTEAFQEFAREFNFPKILPKSMRKNLKK